MIGETPTPRSGFFSLPKTPDLGYIADTGGSTATDPEAPGNPKRKTKMNELKANIEKLALERGVTQLEIISALQAGAAAQKNNELLDMLCAVKWDYITAATEAR
jgi:propanediol dehydratase large subunit